MLRACRMLLACTATAKRPLSVDLDRDLHHSDHLLLPTFDLLRTLLGERDEGVMRSYAKRSEELLQAC